MAAIAASIVSTVLIRRRRDPREKERRRRELVNLQGRVIEGYVTACANHLIEYSYHWRGYGMKHLRTYRTSPTMRLNSVTSAVRYSQVPTVPAGGFDHHLRTLDGNTRCEAKGHLGFVLTGTLRTRSL